MIAASNNNQELVELFIDMANLYDRYHDKALDYALRSGASEPIIALLR